MIQRIALFILFFVFLFWCYKKIKVSAKKSDKNVHWDEFLDIEEKYSAAEYDRHSDYMRHL